MTHAPDRTATGNRPALVLALLVGVSGLVACDREPAAPANVARPDAPVVAPAENPVRNAASEAREAGREAGLAVGEAARAVVDTTRDISITAAVNAKLAADESLSALGINVDTKDGRVLLRGSAPDTSARTRATDLARSVDGVLAVENELSVQPR